MKTKEKTEAIERIRKRVEQLAQVAILNNNYDISYKLPLLQEELTNIKEGTKISTSNPSGHAFFNIDYQKGQPIMECWFYPLRAYETANRNPNNYLNNKPKKESTVQKRQNQTKVL